jgi:foldase protein PrsA
MLFGEQSLMKLRFKFLEISLIVALCFSCQKKIEETKDIIARIDGQNITIKDFRLFYELDPNFGIDSTGYAALLDELYKFIDQKSSYRKAQQTGLTQDSLFIRAKKWEQQQAMLRQLYREKVEKKIEINKQELRDAFLKSNIELHVRHLFTRDPEQAQKLYNQLQAGASLEALASRVFEDTSLAANGGDLGWIKAGDLDDNFAEAALGLDKNEISKPVRTQWGYHIIQLLDRKDQVMLSEAEFDAQKESLRKKIKMKKSQRLANQYIASFMKDLNPQPVPHNFRLLWNAVVPQSEHEKSVLSFNIMFTSELINNALNTLQPYLDKALIRYMGGEVTIREYLKAILQIPVSNRPRFKTRNQFSNQIGIWIRDKLLFEEAQRNRLDRDSKVQSDVQEFIEQQSYLYFLKMELDQINIPEPVKDYFKNKKGKKNSKLSRFQNINKWSWNRAEKNLRESLKSINAEIEIDYKKLVEESKTIDWDKRIRMFVVKKPS